eukprot:jgi/Psemu1/24666/gm1.24666_g
MALELLALIGEYYEDNYLTPDYNNPLLGEEDKRRRDRRTPRIAIKRYTQSPFIYLYQSGNDQALLNCCGVDHVVFRELLDLFEPLYNLYTIDKNTGVIRQKKICATTNQFDATGCLGLPELENLFRCMRTILPIGPEEWDVIANLHAEKYPGRDTDSIRNKHIWLYWKKMQTAKEIKYLIGDRASIFNGGETSDVVTEEFLNQATTQLTQGTQDNQLVPLLLGQPTQPTQTDEATELTPTSTISGLSTNKKRAYNHKADNETNLMSVIAAALKEGRRGLKASAAGIGAPLKASAAGIGTPAMTIGPGRSIEEVTTTADGKLKIKLNNLHHCADGNDSSDDDSDFK